MFESWHDNLDQVTIPPHSLPANKIYMDQEAHEILVLGTGGEPAQPSLCCLRRHSIEDNVSDLNFFKQTCTTMMSQLPSMFV